KSVCLLFICVAIFVQRAARASKAFGMLKQSGAAVLLSLTLLALLSAGSDLVRKLPHLEYSTHTSVLLSADDKWRPGLQTLITCLPLDRPLEVVLNVSQYHQPLVPPLSYLLFKCSSTDAQYQELNITHDNGLDSSKLYCSHNRAFSLSKLSSKPYMFSFHLTLDSRNKVSFKQSMTHTLELRVRVEFREGTELSASLLVYNMDSFSKLNSLPTRSSGQQVTRYILSERGTAFLTSLFKQTNSSRVDSVQLLDDQFLYVLKRAPIFIRPMLSISVMLIHGSRTCSDIAKTDGRILFTTGDSDPDIAQFLFAQPNYFIEIQSGVLTYSRLSLEADLKKLLQGAGGRVRICLRISLNPAVWKYRLALRVADISVPSTTASAIDPSSEPCGSYKNRQSRWVQFSTGMLDAVLMSPVVCSDRTKEVTKVFFNNQECTNYLDVSTHKWQSCGHYSLAQFGNAVLLRGHVNLSHEGTYKFTVQNFVFIFYVSVFSMPLFNTVTANGSLPHVTFANLDMAEISLSDFATDVLKASPSSIETRRSAIDRPRVLENLFVRMPVVTEIWKVWRLTFICRASVDASDVRRMGLPRYSLESRSDVQFYGKRIAASAGQQLRSFLGLVLAVAMATVKLKPILDRL
uniref:EGF-like domain-containing protein n=1 Tax=Macrostomum lignano TaxID=282301 RepID=A0A1I8G5H4_9PLAT